jgi:hypothetical protein
VALVVVVGGFMMAGIVLTAHTSELIWLFLGLPFLLMLLVAARLAPAGYHLAADGVHVERKAGPKVIPYADIRAVDLEARRHGGLTMAGSNGLFGRFGQFWNPRLGLYRLYLSNTHSVVWIHTTRGLVGISPDRPEEFVERLTARIGRGTSP